jgi:protoporphyrinogen oxidase
MSKKPVVIIGAGPAGLAAAHELVRRGIRPLLLERADKAGGIARTEVYKDYYFDVGGHRFFTKIGAINQLWHEMLGEEFLKVSRRSRIYYEGRFFDYPLKVSNALVNLGPVEIFLVVASYLRSYFRPFRTEDTFEQWACNRFGRRLYKMFFETYTEKVWGIPCHQIGSEWAVQRIRGLSLAAAIANAILGHQRAKSLIDEFFYPSKGPGMMWQQFLKKIKGGGGKVCFDSEVLRIGHENGRVTKVMYVGEEGKEETPARHVISSMPVNKLVSLLDPKPPEEVLEAGRRLSYRSFVMVGLILSKSRIFSDQWIYVHSPNVKVGRIQNFKNWSPAMVPDSSKTSLGMEYFCNQGEGIWTLSEEELATLASRELSELGLAAQEDIIDSYVVRQPNAYPVYNDNYGSHLKVIREYLETIEDLQTVGRNGMHRYNNMDHSMQTGKLAVENFFGAKHDLWEVNEEEEYLEEAARDDALQRFREKIVSGAFARMDKLAFASAVGTAFGLLFFAATIWAIIKSTHGQASYLLLLSQYFIGYTVSLKGAFIACAYGLSWGFLLGWLFAYLRNLMLAFYIYRLRKATELLTVQDFLDHF